MELIYSKVEPNKLLHIVKKLVDWESGRQDLVPTNNFLQIATLDLEPNKTFKAHKHIWGDFNGPKIAQESWIVVRGRVEAILYDIDDSIIKNAVLYPGDMSITLEGGHNYMASGQGACVIEVKTGPYLGQALDKVFINV